MVSVRSLTAAPVDPAPGDPVDWCRAAALQGPDVTGRVLLVEDDPDSIRLAGTLLLREGYQVYAAQRGERGLKLAQTVALDLILLDVSLPDLDGYDLCRRLHEDERTRHIPVVFLSARDETRALVVGLDAGAVDYVTKPFDAAVLAARVRAHVAVGRRLRTLIEEIDLRSQRLETAVTQLRDLTAEMALTAERERQELAAGLHDSILQQLAAARMLMEQAQDGGLTAPGGEDAITLVAAAIRGLRCLMFELSPPVLYELGLTAALEWLADHAHSRWQLPFVLRTEGDFSGVGKDLAVLLFQATRELVVNAAKHARAESGLIIARAGAGMLRIIVADDGRGIIPSAAACRSGGFGLFSIRQRLERLGGRMEIDSSAEGTRVTLTVSLDAVGPRRAP